MIEQIKAAIDEGKTIRQIARIVKRHERTVCRIMAQHGVKTKTKMFRDEKNELRKDLHLIAELAKDLTCRQIADKWEQSYDAMYRFTSLHGITCKPAKVDSYPMALRRKAVAEVKSGKRIATVSREMGLKYDTLRTWVLRDE